MIEYFYDCIRATAGVDNTVVMIIQDEEGNNITSGCNLMLSSDNYDISMISGSYEDGLWYFIIPGENTKDLKGRYWYYVRYADNTLCFKQPIYLI